jgi:hypothetical protein
LIKKPNKYVAQDRQCCYKTNKTDMVRFEILIKWEDEMARIAKLMCIMVLSFGALAAHVEAAQTVLFDTGHGERFLVGETGPLQLSGFAAICQTAGIRVATLEQPISDASLAGADALVISGAFQPLKPEEIDALIRFMQRGGKLSVMLHIAPPLRGLLDRLGVSYTNGVILERENILEGQPQDFRVNRLGSHPVLQGINEFSLHGAWGLMSLDDRARTVASTSPQAWVDLRHDKVQTKEETASFGVTCAGEIGKGGFLVFGDDAIFQNKFLDANNKALAVNLAEWLK